LHGTSLHIQEMQAQQLKENQLPTKPTASSRATSQILTINII